METHLSQRDILMSSVSSRDKIQMQKQIPTRIADANFDNPNLCHNCRLVLQECSRHFQGGKQQENFTSKNYVQTIEQFSEQRLVESCHLCRMVFACRQVEEFKLNDDYRNEYPGMVSLVVERETEDDEGLWKLCMARGVTDFYPSFYLIPSLDDPSGISHWAPDGSTLECANRWLEQCVSDHDCCRKSDMSFVPTRLLDIGLDETDPPRLVEHSELPNSVIYMTLSHCWGKRLPLKLLQDNVQQMKKGIPWTHLLKTFQDAVITARHLSVRYIWIDSLCIIQDRPEDWAHESRLMCKIYSSSFCNLAATAGLDGSYGLLFDRKDDHEAQKLSEFPIGDQQYRIIDTAHWQNTVEEQPLFKRGWVFQERLLAPRNLLFGKDGISWECDRHRLTEVYPFAMPPREGAMRIVTRLNPWLENFKAKEPIANLPSSWTAYDHWQTVVQLYSQGALSFETDKLVAISGIAEKFQDMLQDEYVAGMWKENLRKDLLWYVHPGAKSRSNDYIAPTWSWASIPPGINFHRAPTTCKVQTEFVTEVVETKLDLLTGSPLGQLKGGSMILRGPLCSAVLHVNPDKAHCSCCESIDQYEFEIEFPHSGYSSNHRPDARFYPDITLQGKRSTIEGLYCLPIRLDHLTWGEDSAPKHLTHVAGLVLQKTKGDFARWGFWLMSVNNSESPLNDCSEDVIRGYENDAKDNLGGQFGRLGPAFDFFDENRHGHGMDFYENSMGGFVYDIKVL